MREQASKSPFDADTDIDINTDTTDTGYPMYTAWYGDYTLSDNADQALRATPVRSDLEELAQGLLGGSASRI